MARILFVNIPAHGHVNPTLPVVSELVRRGHHVVYYNADTFAQVIQETGAEFRAYPNSKTSEAELAQRIHNLVTVSVFVLEESLRLLPFLLGEIEREKPDVVVFDSIALWGMQATRLKNVPSVGSISTLVQDGVPGVLTWRDFLHTVRQGITRVPTIVRLRRQLVRQYGPAIFPGTSILPCRGRTNIVYTSREFQPDTPYIDDSFHFVGPSLHATAGREANFPWDTLDPERTQIYLSLGTLYNRNVEFYRTAFEALADHPAQIILSMGRLTDRKDLGKVPDNFIVQASVPQLELLQRVELFITHGGMNSVNEGLNYGVPLVVVPQQIEQALNGRQVARQKAGVVLADAPPYGQVKASVLRRAVDLVLGDAIYRLNAERLGRSFREAGGYQRAATVVTLGLD